MELGAPPRSPELPDPTRGQQHYSLCAMFNSVGCCRSNPGLGCPSSDRRKSAAAATSASTDRAPSKPSNQDHLGAFGVFFLVRACRMKGEVDGRKSVFGQI